jgi:hypothetical protein
MTLSKSISLIVATLFLSACGSTKTDNKSADFVPQVNASSNTAQIEIRELVRGRGCNGQFLGIFKSGDANFLGINGINTNNAEGKAKAAAAYNALYGGQDREINTDIIVNPIFRIENTGFFLASQVCATVVGYRGVITSWEPRR